MSVHAGGTAITRGSRNTPQLAPVHNWRTTDLEEIARRQLRARQESFRVTNLDARHPIYSSFRVDSGSGLSYEVEIRDLPRRLKMARVLTEAELPEEARAPLLEAALCLARAMAVRHRVPDPATLEEALRPPLGLHRKEGGRLIREVLGDEAKPGTELREYLAEHSC